MKKVGIMVDNYKLDKFKSELDNNGFKYKTMPFTEDTTAIFIRCGESKIENISKICTKLELGFKRGN